MTERVQHMLDTLRRREYRQQRCHDTWDIPGFAAAENDFVRSTMYLLACLEREQPIVHDGDIFGFNRRMVHRPGIENANSTIVDGLAFGERYSNIIPNYALLMDAGLDAVIRSIDDRLPHSDDSQALFLGEAKKQLQAVLELCKQYQQAAAEAGCDLLAQALTRIPRQRPQSLYEACLFQKILTFALRCGNYHHMALGRFDQYMYPYYLADKQRGLTDAELLETLELYFICLNMDSDLYVGIQQGDNGQSTVLGGCNAEGGDRFNDLSRLCMEASLELSLIDPKINLRVSKKTPIDRYILGTKLTKKGLGFPQYCNDDVVIPGLIALGYRPEDAADYAVAACWEFIIPGHGADIPNCDIFSMPQAVVEALHSDLTHCATFGQLMDAVERAIRRRCDEMVRRCATRQTHYFSDPMPASPLVSLMMNGCLESGRDISDFCLRYYNLGAFGVGISTAADSLAAVKKVVYDERSVAACELLSALDADFAGHTPLRSRLLDCPKMGNDDDYADSIAQALMDMYSRALHGRPTGTGGVWRAGTGSAQFYILSSSNCPATPDGRKAGMPFSCSYSPAPGVRTNGPLSVIRSFTKFDLKRIINGGPLTMELDAGVFRTAQSEQKVAQLVRLYVLSGGHQLQLNTLNKEQLLAALEHPQEHRNLVVRVWGWSGYFTELDKQYQQHILQRTAHTV